MPARKIPRSFCENARDVARDQFEEGLNGARCPLVRQFVADVIETGEEVLRNGATSRCCAGVGWLRCCELQVRLDLLRRDGGPPVNRKAGYSSEMRLK
jgi:hypothetical protein